jgi:hypothetical protein
MTGWSWKLGRVAGIDVYMHGTFLILLAWVGVSHYLQRHRLADAGAGVVFIVSIFAIIALHELGHAVTARTTAFVPATSRSCQSVAWRGWSGCMMTRGRSCSSRSWARPSTWPSPRCCSLW